jgi:hypothetical protein
MAVSEADAKFAAESAASAAETEAEVGAEVGAHPAAGAEAVEAVEADDATLEAEEASDAEAHGLDRPDRAALLAWLALSRSGALAPGADVAATSLAWYDELRLPRALVAGLHGTGFGEGEAWAVTDRVRVLLALPRPSGLRRPASTAPARLLEAWLGSEPVRVAIGLNTWEGVEYVDRDRFIELLDSAVRLDRIDSTDPAAERSSARVAARVAEAAEAAGYRIDRTRERLSAEPTSGRTADGTPGRATPATTGTATGTMQKPAARRPRLRKQDPSEG